LLLVGLLSCVRGVVSAAQFFWPELVALLGLAAWWMPGLLVFALLAPTGVAARAVYGMVGLRRLLARPRREAATTSRNALANRA